MNENPKVKRTWRLFASVVQQNSWVWQLFILGLTFSFFSMLYYPFLYVYRTNNSHRTYDAAMLVERVHQKKLQDAEDAEEAAQA